MSTLLTVALNVPAAVILLLEVRRRLTRCKCDYCGCWKNCQ